jgi:tetratricopeptide (TPR) repeat protein
LFAAVALAACSRAPIPVVDRIAILPFDNLSGDPSLDWVSNAAPSILAEQLVGSPKTVPLRVPTVSDAYLSAATRFVHGDFVQAHGALRFEIQVEDAARHKMIAHDDLNGAVLDAMNRAAHTLDPHAQPFSTSNPEAVAAWAQGQEERATTLDPDFGEAWIAWAESLAARGQTSDAIAVAARGLDRSTLRSPIDRARLAVLSATLRKDLSAHVQALSDLQRLDPADTALLQRLAETEMLARNFPASAASYQVLLQVEPDNTAALLALGYAQAFSGDVDAARRTFETYGKREGQKPNSLDSIGEAYFMNGRFTEAQKYFQEAHQSSPAFLDSADLQKAAFAQWLAGDLKAADLTMARYLEFRSKSHDPLLAWREASWDYSTGRREQAIQTLSRAPRQIAERQLNDWNTPLPADLDALKQAYEQTAPSSDGIARVRYAAALFRVGRLEEARKLVQRWPLPGENADSLLESTVFPLFLDLRKTLVK